MKRSAQREIEKKSRISPARRANATQQLIQGHSTREVARSLGISISTAIRIRNDNIEKIPPKKKGRPNKISPRTKRVLARHFKTGQLKVLIDGQRFIQATDGRQVHVETVRLNLLHESVRAYIQQKRTNLKPNHKRDRLKFAREHIHWTVDDWKRVMFSDESIISRIGPFGRKYYYSDREHKRLLPHQVQPTEQGGGGKIMVWGCITYSGPGDLSRIIGNLDSEFYLEVLDDYVLKSFSWYSMDPANSLFQQDNSRVHTSNLIRKWLDNQVFTVLEWPPYSPDLNVIEHVWGYIKHKLNEYEQPPESLDELWDRVQEAWASIPLEFLQGLYESMPRRMEEVVKNKGGHIEY